MAIRWRLELMEEVGSTQEVALQRAQSGAPEGTVVVAQAQTSGRGRAGRSWASPAGGLYMSIVLRPAVSAAEPQLLSLIAAFSVVLGIGSSTGLKPSIRWPNDVMVGGKKVCGVIADASYSGQSLTHVIVGIGVNCNFNASSLKGLGEPATSLSEELGRPVEIASIRRGTLNAFDKTYSKWASGTNVIKEMKGSVHTLGRNVVARTRAGTEIPCAALDLDEAGGLVVLTGGSRSVLRAEELEWLREVYP